jgi:aspartyl-tRNA(Asn)/glutamyl-tRNA(Gln) amidotransferase subunit B
VANVPITPARLAGLIALAEGGVISSSAAKIVFETMWTSEQSAQAIVDEAGLAQIGDEAVLTKLVADVVAAHPESVEQVRGGRNNVMGFLVGQVMKATQGKANPRRVTELFERAINGG